MVISYFRWWYSEGIIQSARIAVYYADRVSDFFSLPILIKTWIAPWKDDSLTADNASLSDQVKILELNIVSRIIGFCVRTIIILAVILLLSLISILTVISLAIWILIPFAWLLLPALAIVVALR